MAPRHHLLRLFLGGLLLALPCGASAALAPDPSAGISLHTIEEFRTKGIPDDQWPLLLQVLGREEQGSAVRLLIKSQEPFPTKKLVDYLADSRLAVRLGALDLLEDAAADTFGLDPWSEDPRGGGNAEALARWVAWAETGSTKQAATAHLTEETFRTIALEILSGNRERVDRAMQRLDAFGLAGVAHIEAFFKSQPSLEAAPRASLKAAEYRLVLRETMPKQAAALSRELALGTPEAQSTALAALGEAGPSVLPILADLMESPDPLVRETAVDVAFKAGKEHAVSLILARSALEKTESVLHPMLRGLGQYGREEGHIKVLAGFLTHPSENVVISALEALAQNREGDVSDALSARMKDERWRVRAAALEAVGKRNLSGLTSQVLERLGDEDQFVRVTAASVLHTVASSSASKPLLEQFNKRDELKAPILRLLFANNKTPPAEVWQTLQKSPPETILQCLDALEDRDDYAGKRIPFAVPFASHANTDVSASALRLLASKGIRPDLLFQALVSGDQQKQDAVLDELKLPPLLLGAGPAIAPAGGGPVGGARSNSVLDKLYSVFGGSRESPATSPPAAKGKTGEVAPSPGFSGAEMRRVLEGYLNNGSPRQRFRAAVVLVGQGDQAAAARLIDGLDALSNLDRRTVAASLASVDWPPGPILDLATKVLRDEAGDVRETALDTWVDTKKPDRLKPLLAEFARPESRIAPDDLFGYEMDRLAQAPALHPVILEWGKDVLASPTSADSRKTFAIALLGRSGQAAAAGVDKLFDSGSQWVRRAAYRAMGLAATTARLEALLRDDSAAVRGVLPYLAHPHNYGWTHHFDDVHHARDYEDVNEGRASSNKTFGSWAGNAKPPTAVIDPPVLAALEKLTRDPSEIVRFEAYFALLRLGQPVEPGALRLLVGSQPADSYTRERLGNFLEANYQRLGKSYGVLVALATGIGAQTEPEILKHFGMQSGSAFTSFAALAALAPVPAGPATEKVEPEAAAITEPAQQPFRVVYFFKPGCRDCDRVRDMLVRHSANLPQMTLEERNILDSREALLNEALSARFQLRDTLHQVTPAVFTQAGPLVREDITFPRLGELLREASTLPPDAAWAQTQVAEIEAAEETITTRYEALSLGVVAFAGLLDGINPCAFATIIFLLSYLQVARRSPGEILAVGAAFIGAVFITYFAVGLGLAQVLAQIAALKTAGLIMTYTLAAFALVIAVLSFRDAQLAASGQMGEMTLQLPTMLKDQIRGVIRKGSRARHFVGAAFAAGIVISLLELACTGQVYLPTILYMLRAGHSGAVGHLVLYNVAFVTPLIIIFALAWAGMRSDSLIRFQRDHTAAVKVVTGILFLFLTAFILFGPALLGR